MYTAVGEGDLSSAFQEERSWSAANRGWLKTRMLAGAELGSCFAKAMCWLCFHHGARARLASKVCA